MAEVVNTTCYLLNGSPTPALADRILFEVFFGKKSSLSYITIFGCDAFMHIPKEKKGVILTTRLLNVSLLVLNMVLKFVKCILSTIEMWCLEN